MSPRVGRRNHDDIVAATFEDDRIREAVEATAANLAGARIELPSRQGSELTFDASEHALDFVEKSLTQTGSLDVVPNGSADALLPRLRKDNDGQVGRPDRCSASSRRISSMADFASTA
jgi:hypothetical protein